MPLLSESLICFSHSRASLYRGRVFPRHTAMLRALSQQFAPAASVRPFATAAAAASFYEIAGEVAIDGSPADFSK